MNLRLAALVLAVVGSGPMAWAGILHDNGPLVTHPGQGFGGADASAVTSGLATAGFSMNLAASPPGPYRLADNFSVPAGHHWQINGARFFGYQTGSGTASTMEFLSLQIWRGAPDQPGSTVVWGDPAYNVLTRSDFTGIYRVSESTLTANNRPIMSLDADLSLFLGEGEYWLDWAATGALAHGPFSPPVSIPGQLVTGDALRFADGEWLPLTSPLIHGSAQGLPFVLTGQAFSAPEPGQWAMMLLTSLGVAGWMWRRRGIRARP